jgi:hypothetical protein
MERASMRLFGVWLVTHIKGLNFDMEWTFTTREEKEIVGRDISIAYVVEIKWRIP